MNDHKGPDELFSFTSHKLHNDLRKTSPHAGRKTNKENSPTGPFVCVDQLAKVLILGDQDSLFTDCFVNDNHVISARRDFCDRYHIVSSSAKSPNYGKITASSARKRIVHRFERFRSGSNNTVSS